MLSDMKWQPISKSDLIARIDQGVARMTQPQLRLWHAIEIEPVKWKQHPFGNEGGGFWVVAIVGRSVIWYNDREEGFNRSLYSSLGTIGEYFCNHDELEVAVGFLSNSLQEGHDLLKILAQYRAKQAIL
jgi:hypothetical protein